MLKIIETVKQYNKLLAGLFKVLVIINVKEMIKIRLIHTWQNNNIAANTYRYIFCVSCNTVKE